MKNTFKFTFLATIAAVMLSACGNAFYDDSDSYNVQESVKNLSGVWKLKTVTRNDIDITQNMDFSQFQLNLNEDGTYKIDNYLPFVVKENGTWGTDDPHYPFRVTFKENSSADNVNVELKYPVINGKRALMITLSPGCYSNSYTYTLERTTNN